LSAELAALRSQLATLLAKASSTTSFVFARNLSFGMTGSDIARLQAFLATNPALYSEGKVTGYFGAFTLKAVQRFQKKYGIADPGNSGYGTVGPLTRAKLNSLIQQGLSP
jgi:peptidoglycan hydrolase-like protein with peptidoglycan-binding domain